MVRAEDVLAPVQSVARIALRMTVQRAVFVTQSPKFKECIDLPPVAAKLLTLSIEPAKPKLNPLGIERSEFGGSERWMRVETDGSKAPLDFSVRI
jgi:hypothetical protein